jgi:hypothetical protein
MIRRILGRFRRRTPLELIQDARPYTWSTYQDLGEYSYRPKFADWYGRGWHR